MVNLIHNQFIETLTFKSADNCDNSRDQKVALRKLLLGDKWVIILANIITNIREKNPTN